MQCLEQKEPDMFYAAKGTRDGICNTCKECVKKNNKRYKCIDCEKPINRKDKRCKKCHHIFFVGDKSSNWKGGRTLDARGYVCLSTYPNHPNARKDGLIFEHVLIMSIEIGRPLSPGENVHHKNGVKDDNRLSNLELWTKAQPAGQRVEDRIKFYLEEIIKYKTLYSEDKWFKDGVEEVGKQDLR